VTGEQQWRRNLRRSTLALAAANAVAAVVVFVYLAFIVPTPRVDSNHARTLNLITFAIAIIPAFPIITVLSRRRLRGMREWIVAERAPTPAERDEALRSPVVQTEILAGAWALAATIFFVVNLTISVPLALEVGATVLLGGAVTSALGYLLIERINRSNTERALSIGPPQRPAAPGVKARLLLTWGVGTCVFLFTAGAMAIAALASPDGVSLRRLSATVLFLSVAGLLVGLLTMVIAARSIADPVESVRSALREVEGGNTEVEVPVEDGSEVGLLQAGVNRMVAGLREHERLRDLFGRHVGEDVARQAIERGVELGGEVRDAAVLFVDLVGSTALAAERPPEEVLGLLNRFFGVVVEVVSGHDGWINKFEGDAALCVFGAPLELDDAAGCALAAGRELCERLHDEVGELDFGIGVSAGKVVAGNVGAEERFEYTVIGDPVNEAARLTELAKSRDGRLIASEAVLRAAADDEAGRWELDGAVQLRGRRDETRVAVLRSG
jgi:adenylate cyclase